MYYTFTREKERAIMREQEKKIESNKRELERCNIIYKYGIPSRALFELEKELVRNKRKIERVYNNLYVIG